MKLKISTLFFSQTVSFDTLCKSERGAPPFLGIQLGDSPSACHSANGSSHLWSVNEEGSTVQQTLGICLCLCLCLCICLCVHHVHVHHAHLWSVNEKGSTVHHSTNNFPRKLSSNCAHSCGFMLAM